jgi:hypothetical protein
MKSELLLDSDNRQKIIEMFTLLRNINTGTNRFEFLDKEYMFKFKLHTIVKLPNNGDPVYGDKIGGLVTAKKFDELQKKGTSSQTAKE